MKFSKISNTSLDESYINKSVTLYGWVATKRKFGKISFVDLRDHSGIIQLVFSEDIKLSKESVIKVTGVVSKRKDINPSLKTGTIEVLVSEYELLSSSKELPFEISEKISASEDLRMEYRFLDLRRESMQNAISLRSEVFFAIREFLNKEKFLEIETPILAKATPEGARDFLVPTRSQNNFFALPQSPQLFKQLLMASGFEKYYQIARCFRDEDSRKDRQPEFTQLDMEVSFLEVSAFQKLVENLFKYVFKKVLNVDIQTPFQRLDFDTCIKDYGTDKPDLRFDLKIQDINNYFQEDNFEIIKKQASKRMLFINEQITKKDFKALEEIAKKNSANILFYFVLENGKVLHSNFTNKAPRDVEKLIKDHNFKNGTCFIVANNFDNASKALGALRVELNSMFNYAKNGYNFSWIINWPMFEFDEKSQSYQAAHHPFTMFENTVEEFKTLSKNQIKAKSYDLVLNGFELGSGSARIYSKEVQELIFESLGMDKKEQEEKFGFFLKAFDYGLPPHCGIGLGLDRLLMILANKSTIRDVIAFPKNAKNKDVFTKAPSEISSKQLSELFLELKK